VVMYPDGSQSVKTPDGGEIYIAPDGTQTVISEPDPTLSAGAQGQPMP